MRAFIASNALVFLSLSMVKIQWKIKRNIKPLVNETSCKRLYIFLSFLNWLKSDINVLLSSVFVLHAAEKVMQFSRMNEKTVRNARRFNSGYIRFELKPEL